MLSPPAMQEGRYVARAILRRPASPQPSHFGTSTRALARAAGVGQGLVPRALCRASLPCCLRPDSPEAARAGWNPTEPQEANVARLVASGLTNREVAAELVLSTKTVESPDSGFDSLRDAACGR